MAVAGALPGLQCDHDQPVCPLQNITCQCVVIGTEEFPPNIYWYLHSEFVVHFNHLGKGQVNNPNYTASAEVLENGLSSNLSFPAELQSGALTVECVDVNFESSNWSFLIEGLFFEMFHPLFNQSNT